MGVAGVFLEASLRVFALLLALLLTLTIEGFILWFYARWQNKPLRSLLLSGLLVNLLTQPLLWFWLAVFYRSYWIALLAGEMLIFIGEALFIKLIPANHLSWRGAFSLSLVMNGLSFGIGLFLAL